MRGARAVGPGRAVRCAPPRPGRDRRATPPPRRGAIRAADPPRCAPPTHRSQGARPGPVAGGAAAGAGRRAAGADVACGLAKPTAPLRSAAETEKSGTRRLGLECRAVGRAGCRSFPWRSAPGASRGDAKSDQEHVIEIPRFRFRETAIRRAPGHSEKTCPTVWYTIYLKACPKVARAPHPPSTCRGWTPAPALRRRPMPR